MRLVARMSVLGMLLTITLGVCEQPLRAQAQNTDPPRRELYRIAWLRAAPGKLLELIDIVRGPKNTSGEADSNPPLILRHSQGDQWDLMVILPVGSYSKYFDPDQAGRSRQVSPILRTLPDSNDSQAQSLIAWREDEFMWGPPSAELRAAFAPATLFHAEIFISLAGKRADLIAERQSENRYQRELSRPEGFIFTKDLGAAWDVMTVAPYRSWKHFAQRDDIMPASAQAAARAAGFKSPDDIGPFLRSLIAMHHDTLCTAVR